MLQFLSERGENTGPQTCFPLRNHNSCRKLLENQRVCAREEMQLIPAGELLLQHLVSPPASHCCSFCPSGMGPVKEKNQPLDARERITPQVQLLQGVLKGADPIKWRMKFLSQQAARAQLFRAAWRSRNQRCASIKWLIDYCQPVIM